MPFKLFADGQILTAADVMTFMMKQQMCVFADATARDAAITDPEEGQFAFLTGTNRATFFDGTIWRNL